MHEEKYVTVKASMKEAEKFIRNIFPNARKDRVNKNLVGFSCKKGERVSLMFIYEEEI